MDFPIGEIAALLAAFSFSLTSLFYTLAGRKVNAIISLATSLPISGLVMIGVHQVALGQPFPFGATADRWFYLSASGILAFVVSSYFMLTAYQDIGPRLTMLIASFAPVLGAILAWIFLGQSLPTNALLGITVVMVGIISVVAERSPTQSETLVVNLRRGVIFACLGTLAQSTAFVFSSLGVSDGFPPFSATLIRITAGVITLWIVVALQGNIRMTLTIFNDDRRTLLLIIGAAVSGAVIAGSLLLLAFQFVTVGVATTLSHTTAIMLIPISFIVFKEKITPRAVIGTVIAIVGIGILFIQ